MVNPARNPPIRHREISMHLSGPSIARLILIAALTALPFVAALPAHPAPAPGESPAAAFARATAA